MTKYHFGFTALSSYLFYISEMKFILLYEFLYFPEILMCGIIKNFHGWSEYALAAWVITTEYYIQKYGHVLLDSNDLFRRHLYPRNSHAK